MRRTSSSGSAGSQYFLTLPELFSSKQLEELSDDQRMQLLKVEFTA